MKALAEYFLMVVFTLLLNRVHVFANFMFNLNRESPAVKGAQSCFPYSSFQMFLQLRWWFSHRWDVWVFRIGSILKRMATTTSGGKRNIYLWSSYFPISICLLWLYPVCFYFHWNSVDSSISSWTKWWMLISSWNVSHLLKTAWKWSSWSLIWEQDGTNVSFISNIL